MSSSVAKKISFLLISDIHERQENLDFIRLDLVKQADYVICLGDICNLDAGGVKNMDTSKLRDLGNGEYGPEECDERDATNLRNARAEIHRLREKYEGSKSGRWYYYIPGNHDPFVDFMPDRTTSSHNQIVPVNERLFMAFFGGALPGYRQRDGVQEWEGYPFESDDELHTAMGDLRERVSKELKQDTSAPSPQKQMILFTHCGPSESQTTLFWKDTQGEIITSGSQSMSNWLKTDEMQRHCIANLHGHTHPAVGRACIAQVPVINVGSIREGRYAFMEVELDEKDDKYRVASVQMFEFHVEDPYGLLQKWHKMEHEKELHPLSDK